MSCVDRHEYYGNVKIYYMQIRCAEVDWAGQPGHFTEHWQSRIGDHHHLESGELVLGESYVYVAMYSWLYIVIYSWLYSY